ncbi:MAG: phenylalanine--tRNA ligase subunit alpha [Bacteroidales bacterium]|jgi:phenylalanyl-tRNA synthetase alpha chain|nr:phenylalanine--tRNA ligase subunit alpha [Bacteroidales bacterium]
MQYKVEIEQLLQEAQSITFACVEEVENYRIRLLGKKGVLGDLFEKFKTIPNEEKREVGQALNALKTAVENAIATAREKFENTVSDSREIDDLTRPSGGENGHRHPIWQIRDKIIDIFSRIGFVVAEGPEIEDDWHNFSALNFPPDHPARDMQDTFFVESGDNTNNISLRTHTSSVQVRIMEKQKPPIRAIFPGRVYRNEAISARAHCFFHQVEGLYIDKNVSFADLRETLLYFAKEMFGSSTKIRLRPSYFPFTEPSAEMDIECSLCGGKGCPFCKHTGWVEILGCGMVDPNVLENCNIDSKVYSGFAFGMGIERQANLKYGVKDLRLFSENDKRFLAQF